MTRFMMNQQEYLQRFRMGIAALPPRQAQLAEDEVLRQLEQGRSNGMGDNTIQGILGMPEDLARDYITSYRKKRRARSSPGKRIGFAFGLLLVDIFVAVPVALAAISLWVALLLGIPIVIGGVLLMLCFLFIDVIPNIFFLFDYPHVCLYGGLFCLSAGLAMTVSSSSFGRWVMHIGGLFIDFNVAVFTGKGGI